MTVQSISTASPVRRRLRQPRVAEIVADVLRSRILSGEIGDGDQLPKQDEMIAEFGVSQPCIREALRILETEGLITVIRGNLGGARVHFTQSATAAYVLGLALQTRGISRSDLVDALRGMEPACAGYCAGRKDRNETVVPALRENIARSRNSADDADAFIGLAREFHVLIVSLCGNATMAFVVGALETLWSAQVETLARKARKLGDFADRATRLLVISEHEALVAIIEAGDAAAAEQTLRKNFSRDRGDRRFDFDDRATIVATALKDWTPTSAVSPAELVEEPRRGRGRPRKLPA